MTRYSKLTVGEKDKRNCDKMREPAVTCPLCEAKTPVDDLLAHMEKRCPRKRDIHPRSRWVTRAEAVAMGLNEGALKRWVRRGRIRRRSARGERTGLGRPSRQYLARDIVKLLAARWIWSASDPESEK